ncbi:DNA-3-methyladenine glycosylase I [Desulfoluna limicola]|uniref:DNA-3-methyladenine glycosylase I n=1 Tax=Desulfoluna limicola TaxID=2810562 RepID=A0ABN6F3I4_9BACT|nr:DNA-3-methyladenine glycosylase I [Desulfoluna limicola]BCS96328.1 DNA-3-methyladenine glycosylase I [Desulfoluna limicola]
MREEQRCSWCGDTPIYVTYHDEEWGVPVRDSRELFAMLLLEGFQAGLSWITVLKKRAHYLTVMDGLAPEKIALYDETKIEALLADPGIIRNKLKVRGSVKNAKAYLAHEAAGHSFSELLWGFTGGNTLDNGFRTMEEMPTSTPESDAMSKALKKLGFTFVGSTICYAFMQAVGMVNDHVVSCPRYRELGGVK